MKSSNVIFLNKLILFVFMKIRLTGSLTLTSKFLSLSIPSFVIIDTYDLSVGLPNAHL